MLRGGRVGGVGWLWRWRREAADGLKDKSLLSHNICLGKINNIILNPPKNVVPSKHKQFDRYKDALKILHNF